jgi:HAD superfamily hydrolase (TIGR01549 family)
MAPKAVLFDLGNTLWHIPEPPPVEAIRNETVRRILDLLRSWDVEPDDGLRFIGRDIRLAITAADREAYESDAVSPDFAGIVRQVGASHGLSLTPAQAERLWHTWNLEGAFFGRRLFDGAIEALDALRGRGLRLACVTNRAFGGPAFMAEVEEHGLAPYFDVMSVSCEVGYMKPHPKLYHHALEALDVEPSDAVMVGDSLKADVAGSQALGMTAVWRRHDGIREDIDGVQPDFVIDELRELPLLPCFD